MNDYEYDPTADARLESFDNPEKSRIYSIQFTCPEWTALCPKSGFPDFGILQISYEPRDRCVELKSLKLYLNSFRHVPIFHEAAVNRVLTDLVEQCKPWKMEVMGDFNVRGNIKTIIRAAYQASDYPRATI